MALRLIEVFLPKKHGARLQESLSKDGVVAHWTEQLSEQQILVRILLQVEDRESLLDRIEEGLEGTDFRAVLVSAEATFPRLELARPPTVPISRLCKTSLGSLCPSTSSRS